MTTSTTDGRPRALDELKTVGRSGLGCFLATAADFLALVALVSAAGVALAPATVAAATCGALANYLLQRRVAFRARDERKRRQMPRYLAVAASTIAVSAALTVALASPAVGLHYVLARLAASVLTFLLWHYPLARWVVFRRPARPEAAPRPGAEASRQPLPDREPAVGAGAPELSVVVPAYNEEERLPPTLEAMGRVLASGRRSSEIIVVDDGSTDRTAEVVRSLSARMPGLRLLRYERNRGKGFAVRTGVMEARGELVVFADADGSVPMDQAEALLARLEAGAEVAIGSRYAEGAAVTRPQPWYRVVWSRLANGVVRCLLLPKVRDTQCGFKAFRRGTAREVFSRLTIERWGFDLEVLALCRRLGRSVVEVPVRWADDSRSRIAPARDLLGVVSDFLAVEANLLLGRYDLPPQARAAQRIVTG